MSWKCRRYRKLIDQAYAGSLDHASRRDLEKHAAGCQACSSYWTASQQLLEYNQQWREMKQRSSSVEVPAGLNNRIILAIREEAAKQGLPVNTAVHVSMQATQNRPIAWNRYASVAAAVLLLLVGWQILAPRLQNARTGNELAVIDAAGNSISTATRQSVVDQKAGYPTEKTVFGASDWRLFSGNFADVIAPCTSISDYGGATSIAGDPSITENANSSEAFQPADELDGQDLLVMLDQATAIRIYKRLLPSEQTLILAAYPNEDAARQYDVAKTDLTSCVTPFRIEIIKIDQLPTLINGFTGDMLVQTIESSLRDNDGLSWIMILIGA
jgi:hypothetical protein